MNGPDSMTNLPGAGTLAAIWRSSWVTPVGDTREGPALLVILAQAGVHGPRLLAYLLASELRSPPATRSVPTASGKCSDVPS